MTFRTLLIIKAAVCLAFGALLLFTPVGLLGVLGGDLGGAATFTAREYGAALVGTLLLTWFAKGVKAGDARRAILLDLLVYDAIGVVVTVQGVVSAVLNALGWAIVAVYYSSLWARATFSLARTVSREAWRRTGPNKAMKLTRAVEIGASLLIPSVWRTPAYASARGPAW